MLYFSVQRHTMFFVALSMIAALYILQVLPIYVNFKNPAHREPFLKSSQFHISVFRYIFESYF